MANKEFVFISYSSRDIELVQKITRMLEDMKVPFWKAPEMIPAGSNYAREIPKAIQNCEVFLLILSQSSQNSVWVEKEIDSAICYRKTIIPIKIDDTPLNDLFRFYLNNVQTISYFNSHEKVFYALKEQLVHIIVKANQPEPNNQSQNDYLVKGPMRKSDALVMNRIPIECQYCGGSLKEIDVGTYRCDECGKDNYDYLRAVRNYLERVGPKPAIIIERDTGVPRKAINYFLKQEYLEIPKSESIRLACEVCGAPIRTGILCDTCKKIKGH